MSHRKLDRQKLMVLMLFALVVLELIGLGALALTGMEKEDTEKKTDTGTAEQMPEWLEPQKDPVEDMMEHRPTEDTLSAKDILKSSPVVVHGMGAVDGVPILNCKEGFLAQYARGARVFEVDLRLTSDMEVVLRHDWRAKWQDGISEVSIPTLREFKARPILGKYTPMSFRDLLELMMEYPDICIITDTKFTDPEIVTVQFQRMLEIAQEMKCTYLFDRMAIQVYTQLMYKVVSNLWDFPWYIYTLYAEGFARTDYAFREKAEFCKENGILGMTMWDYWWSPSYGPIAKELGLMTFAHTVNDQEKAEQLLRDGIDAVYTDILAPEDIHGAERQQA